MNLPLIKLVDGPFKDVIMKAQHPWPRTSLIVSDDAGRQAVYHVIDPNARPVEANFYNMVTDGLE
jgi:hypothetical protein